jgi:hypothetical protein
MREKDFPPAFDCGFFQPDPKGLVGQRGDREQQQIGVLNNAQSHLLEEIGVGGLDYKVGRSGKEVGLCGNSAGGRNILQTFLIHIIPIAQFD